MRIPLLLLGCSVASTLPAHAFQHSLAAKMRYGWGGETRQVFTRDVGGQTRVWTVGDGALIRHKIDPVGDDWTYQTPPAGVTQTLLDVYFLPDGVEGWACGVGGNVLWTTNGGSTWQHQAGANPAILNTGGDPATLWRTRFNKSQSSAGAVGFANGLWTFKRWINGAWGDVELVDEFGNPLSIEQYEFYSLALSVDPSNPANWIALAAGQSWEIGHPELGSQGEVFFAESTDNNGLRWKRVFQTLDGAMHYDDPWDIEFEPNPTNYDEAAGYLGGGGATPPGGEHSGTGLGCVYRFVDGGSTSTDWDLELSVLTPPLGQTAPNTFYGVAALSADEAIVVGYAGRVWHRSSGGVWTERNPNYCATPATCDFTGPLSAACATSTGAVYASGSWGFLRRSTDDWAHADDLNTSSSGHVDEHLRLMDVHFVSDDVGFAVGQNRSIAKSSDGGRHFDLVDGGSSFGSSPSLLAIDLSDDETYGVACGLSSASQLPLSATPTKNEALALYYSSALDAWLACPPPSTLTDDPSLGGTTAASLNSVAWAAGGDGNVFWAVGEYTDDGALKPLLLRSENGGRNWTDMNDDLGYPIPDGVRLTGIDMVSSTAGTCVGRGFYDSIGVAYRIDMLASPGSEVVDVSPVGAKPLHSVAVTTNERIAVGDDDQVFVDDLVGTTMTAVTVPHLHPSLPTRLSRVAIAPGGRVLIGAYQFADEVNSPALGKMLQRSNGIWTKIPALTSKHVVGLQLRSNNRGWALGTSSIAIDTGDDSGTSSDPEFGQVGESVVLRYAQLP